MTVIGFVFTGALHSKLLKLLDSSVGSLFAWHDGKAMGLVPGLIILEDNDSWCSA